MRKMFRCPNCGLIVELYGTVSGGTSSVSLSFDHNGKFVKTYYDHDYDELDGWYCLDCDSEIDVTDIEEVDDIEDD